MNLRFPGYENVEFEEKKPRGWQVGTDDKTHYAPTIFKYDEFRNIGSTINFEKNNYIISYDKRFSKLSQRHV